MKTRRPTKTNKRLRARQADHPALTERRGYKLPGSRNPHKSASIKGVK